MERSDIQKVIAYLREQVGFLEAYQVTSFTGFRELPGEDEVKQVNIELLDAGENADHPRYQVYVQDEDGRMAHGEPADDLETLLAGVHWFHLNEPPAEEEEEDDLGGQIEVTPPDAEPKDNGHSH